MIHVQYSFIYYLSVLWSIAMLRLYIITHLTTHITISMTSCHGILTLTYSIPATMTTLLFLEHSQHASNMKPLHVLFFPLPNALFPQISKVLPLLIPSGLRSTSTLSDYLYKLEHLVHHFGSPYPPHPIYFYPQDLRPSNLVYVIYQCLFIVHCPHPQLQCKLHEGRMLVLLAAQYSVWHTLDFQ